MQQKLTWHCNSTILQLKNKKLHLPSLLRRGNNHFPTYLFFSVCLCPSCQPLSLTHTLLHLVSLYLHHHLILLKSISAATPPLTARFCRRYLTQMDSLAGPAHLFKPSTQISTRCPGIRCFLSSNQFWLQAEEWKLCGMKRGCPHIRLWGCTEPPGKSRKHGESHDQ